jgi:5-methylcytosine-specific restriction enzyme subunit McrC
MIVPPPLSLTEGGPGQTVALTGAQYRAVNDLGIAVVTPTVTEGLFDVVAARKVGAVTVGDQQIVVRPKITDLNRLLFLLGYARNPQIWRDEPVHVEAADELLPAVAEAFARIATRTIERGLHQGYVTISDTLPVLRGRMLGGEQMSRRYGLPVPIAVEYDDFTVDIAENQLLAMATLRLLAVPRLSSTARRLLQRLRRSLAEVSVPPRGVALPRWQPSRLNARYEAALRLAEIVLAAESFEHHVGELTVTGYMFDMWKIFEDFVTVSMSESLTRRGWHCETQAGLHLDDQHRIDMRPDLLCRHASSASAVIDAKYKAERPEGFPNADLYQMLAYCTVLGLPEGYLIYAKGNEEGAVHTVQRAGITIHCRALDLGLEPSALLAQVDKLGAAVVRGSAARTPVAMGT